MKATKRVKELMGVVVLSEIFVKALREQYPELNTDPRVCMLHESLKSEIKKGESL